MADDTTRRKFLVATGSGAVAALAGCAGNPPNETDTTEKTTTEATEGTDTTETEETTETTEGGSDSTGGTLRLASIGRIQTLDPANAKGSGAGYNQYAESLLEFPNGDLPPKPSLAKDYSVSNDGKTYTFSLKEGVKFHSGKEFGAKDVVYSWERLAQSEHSRNKDDIVGGTMTIAHEKDPAKTKPKDEATPSDYIAGTLQVRAPDQYTFEFDLESPFHGTLSQIAGGAFAVIPENSVGDIERDGIETDGKYDYNEFFSTSGDGPKFDATGAFKVESWSKGDQIKLSAFEDYHGEGPYIDAITFTVLSGSEAAYQRFQNQNLDILGTGSGDFPTSNFDPDKRTIESDEGSYRVGTYGPMDNGETVNYGEATILDTDYILFNCSRTEQVARQALAMIINQHNIAETIYKGIVEPAYELTPPPVFPNKDTDMDPSAAYDAHAKNGEMNHFDFAADGYPWGYNEAKLNEATHKMEEAGYSESNMYEIGFTVFSGSTVWDQLAKRMRDKARAAHIDMTIKKSDFGTILSQGGFNHNLDMFSLGDGMEWPESDNFLRFLHPSAASASAGFTQWGEKTDSGEWKTDLMAEAEDMWQNEYKPNRAQGKQHQLARDEAYIAIEETNWQSMQELPTVHSLTQRFWYDDVDARMAGTMENQMFNTARINRN